MLSRTWPSDWRLCVFVPCAPFLGGHGEDESQQAAEAMVQLSGVGFYAQQGNYILSALAH